MRPVFLVTRLRHRSVGLGNEVAVASLGWLRHRSLAVASLGWLRHCSPISFTSLACHFVMVLKLSLISWYNNSNCI